MKGLPKDHKGITGGNHWVPQYVQIPVLPSLEDCIRMNKEMSRSQIGSIKLLGMQYFMGLLLNIPYNIAKLTISRISKQISMTYSNVPTTSENFDYGGIATCNSITGFLPPVGEMQGGLIAIQHGSILKIGLCTDTHYYRHPDLFMKILHRNINDFMAGKEINVSQSES